MSFFSHSEEERLAEYYRTDIESFFEATLEADKYWLNMGPQHPSTHGVFRMLLQLDGEKVADVVPYFGYLHRAFEKLGEYREYQMITPLTDRMDYLCAATMNMGYCLAVDRLMGIEVPRRGEYMRIIAQELNRIASHLVWLASFALDLGGQGVFLYCFRERERILDLFDRLCGTRQALTYIRPGGVSYDVPPGWLGELKDFLNKFPGWLKEYEELLTENEIFVNRVTNIGIISAEDALNYGMSGPNLRGSGVKWDIRRDDPYNLYEEFDFEIPAGRGVGDVLDRYHVRLEEMRQSTYILLQAIENLPEGPIMADKVGWHPKIKPGESSASVESARGEFVVYLKADGTKVPYRTHFKSPCLVNLTALRKLLIGNLIADIMAIFGSLDVVLGEVDR